MSEMFFPGIVAANNQPGLRMTKNLFKQIVLEHWEPLGSECCDENPVNGEILGWVLYNWRDDGRNERYFGLLNDADSELQRDNCEGKPKPLHVLWKKGNQYRRTFIYWWEDLFDPIKMNQLFLGGFVN